VHELTGLVLSPHYGASKLRWCLDHLPQVQAAAAAGELAFGPLSSFILFKLLEEQPLVVDPANASRTQLWNPATRKWEPRLLEWFGIDASSLPQPVTSRHVYGSLPLGTGRVPLSVCTGDQSAVPFAFGSARSDTAYVNLGTGAFIQRPLASAQDAAAASHALLRSILWSDKRTITAALEGTVNGAGCALQWFAEREGVDTTHLLQSLSAVHDPALKPPLFLNGISGLGSPFWIADFQSRFEGRGDAREQFIAILESILFLIRVNLDEMGAPLERLVVTGGLAGSGFVCRGLADLTHRPVVRYEEREATARGLAFLIAGAPRDWPAPPSQVFEPQLNTALRERFFAWLKLMKQAIAER
jgi:glycerol kinase